MDRDIDYDTIAWSFAEFFLHHITNDSFMRETGSSKYTLDCSPIPNHLVIDEMLVLLAKRNNNDVRLRPVDQYWIEVTQT